MTIRPLTTDSDIARAYALMAQLRPHLKPETFLADIRDEQKEAYTLIGGYIDETLITLAGIRQTRTLFRGPHLFVDDLVTLESHRGKGHGAAMLRWLGQYALDLGLTKVYLDSRNTARGFYEKLGFTFSTSIPCAMDAAELVRKQ